MRGGWVVVQAAGTSSFEGGKQAQHRCRAARWYPPGEGIPQRCGNVENMSAEPFVPPNPTLPKLRKASQECRGCPLWERGTQTVFGEGAAAARVMHVGEQPGDHEYKEGRPFVGPAGKLLDRALEEAGIDRSV